ncbi:MAG: hypothetical protein GKR89_09270 [Candidatus Latescibacteria bacterium]|nr:hypothetical protein [Candidatus Latescibacterota bacterium]
MSIHSAKVIGWTLLVGLIAGCGAPFDPVQETARELSNYPEYSVIIDDLQVEEGGFSNDYFIRLRILTAKGARVAGRDTLVFDERITENHEVSEKIYARYQNYLGMVVASRDGEGRETTHQQAHPPAYQYVGNPHYGHWGPGGFWAFYGQYMFMSQMLGGWRVGRDDYGDYRRDRERGRPYYGPRKDGRSTFGTSGSQTQKTKPNFYQRQKSRTQASQRAFSANAQNRSGRTSSSWGRGSSRGGK